MVFNSLIEFIFNLIKGLFNWINFPVIEIPQDVINFFITPSQIIQYYMGSFLFNLFFQVCIVCFVIIFTSSIVKFVYRKIPGIS